MTKFKHNVDTYLAQGCGRCALFATPACKVNNWREVLIEVREIILQLNLKEEIKWGVPCYTHNGKNILLLSCLKDYTLLAFFKGSLLKNKENLVVAQTENVQATRIIKFTKIEEVLKVKHLLIQYIKEAIELEKSNKKVEFKKTEEYPIPEELELKFKQDAAFKKAFYNLTPGRQRGYLLFFSAPKNSKTKVSRIEASEEKIYKGIGLTDRN